MVSDAFELVKDCQRAVVYTIVQVLVNLRKNVKPNVIKLLCVFQRETDHVRADVCNMFVLFLHSRKHLLCEALHFIMPFLSVGFFSNAFYTYVDTVPRFYLLHLFMFYLKKLPPATYRSPVSTVFAADVLLSTYNCIPRIRSRFNNHNGAYVKLFPLRRKRSLRPVLHTHTYCLLTTVLHSYNVKTPDLFLQR